MLKMEENRGSPGKPATGSRFLGSFFLPDLPPLLGNGKPSGKHLS